MKLIQGKVKDFAIGWAKAPVGAQGESEVVLADGKSMPVRWKKDAHGLWVELPHGTFGFDIEGTMGDDDRLSYRLSSRGHTKVWNGLTFVRAGEAEADSGAAQKKKKMKIKAQMPGKIIKLNVIVGQNVEKGQTLIIMEAMKMENEIKAHASGVVVQISIEAGQAVETGHELAVIE